MGGPDRVWNHQQSNRRARLERAGEALGTALSGKILPADRIADLLHRSSSAATASVWKAITRSRPTSWRRRWRSSIRRGCNGLHMLLSVLALPEHLDVFEKGIASAPRLFLFRPAGGRLARLVDGRASSNIGAIHTYLELFGRYFIDLTPRVSLIAAQAADRGRQSLHRAEHRRHAGHRGGDGIQERHRDRPGQRIVDMLPRVDIPADWVDFVVQSPAPNYIEPLFTRDPAQISEIQVLMAMMAIKGIYAEYGVKRLNHGIGFDTAAIELILPTYAQSPGPEGQDLPGTGP